MDNKEQTVRYKNGLMTMLPFPTYFYLSRNHVSYFLSSIRNTSLGRLYYNFQKRFIARFVIYAKICKLSVIIRCLFRIIFRNLPLDAEFCNN